MSKVKKLSFLFVFALIFSFLFSCLSYADETYHYATTDMTWAEFYAAEVEGTVEALEAAGLDAYSNPTTRMAASFPVYHNISGDTTEYYGIKDVRVRMTDTIYNSLTDKSRYTFVDEAFETDYKDVDSDGTFGKMVTETMTPDSEVTLTSGSSTRWGNYLLAASNVDIAPAKYLGAVITTSDGSKYGLRHANNLWRNSQIALTYEEGFTEAHGYPREYAYTSDLEGKTITGITYMRLDSEDVVLSGLNIYLKTNPGASVKVVGDSVSAGTDVTAKFELTNAPDDSEYKVTTFSKGEWVENLRHGQPGWRWNALTEGTDYTYSQEDQTIIISGDVESGDYYQAVFTSEKYVDINTYFYAYSFKYATTNMTFAEFYAGELETSAAELTTAGLDAFSNPTISVANPEDTRHYIPVLWASRDVEANTTTFYGVKDIPVRMTEDVYNALSDTDKERFTISDSAFDEFKEVSSDLSFGKMSSDITEIEAEITLSSGSSARWGNYVLVPSGVTVDPTKYIGATITTSDGKTYGLRHDSSIWRNNNVALTYDEDFTEAHGYTRAYEYTSDIEGKTVTNIIYMFLDSPDISVSCNIFLKKSTTATVAPVYNSGNAFTVGTSNITLKFNDLPDDADYDLSRVTFGTGRSATDVSDCTYSEGVLTIPNAVEGTYTATFSSETYADIAATIEFVKSSSGGSNNNNNNSDTTNNNSNNGNSNSDSNSGNTGGNPAPRNNEPMAIKKFTAPRFDISNSDNKKTVLDLVKNVVIGLPDNTDVAALSEGAPGVSSVTARENSSVSDADRSYIAEQNQEIAAILPVVVITESKIYVFSVNLSNLNVGEPIFWQPMEKDTNSSSGFKASASSNSNAVFMDSQGNKVTTVPSDKTVDVAAYLEAGKTYEPLITTASSSSNSDNTDNGTNNNNVGSDEDNEVGGSGGGCNIFSSVIMLGIFCQISILLKKN